VSGVQDQLHRHAYGALQGHRRSVGLEGEVGFREKLKHDKALTGDRLTVADVDRFYTCPECGERGQLPPEDELRRHAEEQGG
jgi:hypothetical protein